MHSTPSLKKQTAGSMKISVCMATYNSEEYIREQIDSILPQLNNGDELIISDDGSTDNTLKIINKYSSAKIVLLHHKADRKLSTVHAIVSKNFENALIHASGDIIFLSDQDDIWMPDKISKTLPYFKEYDYIISDCYHITNNLIDFDSSHRGGISPFSSFFSNVKKLGFQGCCSAFKSEVLNNALPFPRKLYMHDGWIGLLAAATAKVYFLDEKLIAYRIHNQAVTKQGYKNTLFYKIEYRLHLVIHVLKRKYKIL